MQQDKVKVKISGASSSMLGCLWSRAQLSREYSSLFFDAKAVELVEQIDYTPDFSASDVPPFEDIMVNVFFSRKINQTGFGLFTLRAKQFDEKAKAYIAEHPRASVINIAAGLDTTFYRVDNGSVHWYDLDLPAVIEIRKQLLPEPDRVTYIAKSFLDQSWCKDVNTENGVFMIAGGVLLYFEEAQVKRFFSLLADNLPDGEIVFDAPSRKIRRTGLIAPFKWTLRDANKITKWDTRVKVIDQFPLFKNIPRDPAWSIDMRRFMDISERCRLTNIFHLRV